MVRVLRKPESAGIKFTVDMELSGTHSYQVVSPAGTNLISHNSVSLLAGSTPGVHWPISQYYIRRVRLMNNSNLLGPLREAGFNIEPCYGSEASTVVVEFPIALTENIRTEQEVSIWEKAQLAVFIQKWWADNQVSVTITFDPETEGSQIEPILEYLQYNLKSVSFLPMSKGVFKQMPYEAVTAEKYHELSANLSKLKFTKDIVSQEGEKEVDVFCDSTGCMLVNDSESSSKKRKAQS